MKHIEAVIRPHKLDELKDVLAELGVPGMTVTEVKGFGRSKGKREVYRGSSYVVDFVPKVKVEIVVSHLLAPQIADVLMTAVRTGKIGDGKLFVSEIDSCVRIRTGERDEDAL
jgi:nitrogen regulatory protein P-II 1